MIRDLFAIFLSHTRFALALNMQDQAVVHGSAPATLITSIWKATQLFTRGDSKWMVRQQMQQLKLNAHP